MISRNCIHDMGSEVGRSRKVVPEELVTLISWDPGFCTPFVLRWGQARPPQIFSGGLIKSRGAS